MINAVEKTVSNFAWGSVNVCAWVSVCEVFSKEVTKAEVFFFFTPCRQRLCIAFSPGQEGSFFGTHALASSFLAHSSSCGSWPLTLDFASSTKNWSSLPQWLEFSAKTASCLFLRSVLPVVNHTTGGTIMSWRKGERGGYFEVCGWSWILCASQNAYVWELESYQVKGSGEVWERKGQELGLGTSSHPECCHIVAWISKKGNNSAFELSNSV